MNIGTHLVNNMLEIAGHVRRVTAAATTGGRAITPHDVLPAPSGMGVIAGENITATLSFGTIYIHPDQSHSAYLQPSLVQPPSSSTQFLCGQNA